ncbi:MAG: hypothetical protein HN916_04335, partial [Anaerolineae bacterium]|nr:hypothetical protein [Anaerolineae bacterium]
MLPCLPSLVLSSELPTTTLKTDTPSCVFTRIATLNQRIPGLSRDGLATVVGNLVDATNYAVFEVGEPLHAFDYDVLVERAKGKEIIISTRTAEEGEKLTTLDNVVRELQTSNVLVCDEAGALA